MQMDCSSASSIVQDYIAQPQQSACFPGVNATPVSTSNQHQYGSGSGYTGGFGGSVTNIKIPGGGGGAMRTSYALQLKVQQALATMTLDEKFALGHPVADLLVDCEFAGSTCYPTW